MVMKKKPTNDQLISIDNINDEANDDQCDDDNDSNWWQWRWNQWY